jgi:hypothetical protein
MSNIKGIENLTPEQQEHLLRCNKHHTRCVGADYKSGMQVIEAWVEDGTVCARLANGDWYHYSKDGSWW